MTTAGEGSVTHRADGLNAGERAFPGRLRERSLAVPVHPARGRPRAAAGRLRRGPRYVGPELDPGRRRSSAEGPL